MKRTIETIVVFLLVAFLTQCLITACTSHEEIPVQTETTGADKTYRHGEHCIDMRAF